MLRTMMRGLPGRCRSKKGAISRAVASVPPPGAAPVIILIVLPLKSAADATAPSSASSAANVTAAINLRIIPSLHMKPVLALQLFQEALGRLGGAGEIGDQQLDIAMIHRRQILADLA